MSDHALILDIMRLVHIDYHSAKEVLLDSRMRFYTDTQLDKVRYKAFVNRLPTYQKAMRFA